MALEAGISNFKKITQNRDTGGGKIIEIKVWRAKFYWAKWKTKYKTEAITGIIPVNTLS